MSDHGYGSLLNNNCSKKMPETERNYLQEARHILTGCSLILPEKRHLEALEEAHEVRLIQLMNDLESLKRKVLNGN